MDLILDNDGKTRKEYWKQSIESLRSIKSDLLFDDWIEENIKIKKTRPWAGIFHFPPKIGEFYNITHRKMFASPEWSESARYLRVAFAMSEYLAKHIRHLLACPVFTVLHPMAPAEKVFDEIAFLLNDNKRIHQLGWYFRNTLAIHQLPSVIGYQKTCVGPEIQIAKVNQEISHQYWKKHGWGERRDHGHVHLTRYVNGDEYDELLTRNVMFMEVFDASASKAVLECMVRHTPLVVNRHPALEEYLGRGYPLFYNEFDEAHLLFDTDKVVEGHRYLKEWMEKQDHTRPETFAKTVADALSSA